jgi:hypothetical protein
LKRCEKLRSALVDHDARAQCALYAPLLLESRGGSVTACAKSLREEDLPYIKSLKALSPGVTSNSVATRRVT